MAEQKRQPDDLHTELWRFRASHRYSSHNGWHYLASGHGTEALLLLPGLPGLGEMAFQHITRFEQGYRVIAPSYPSSATTVAQILDGLLAILSVEGVERVHVLGASYSGMVAQCLACYHPEKVQKVILDHTSLASRRRAWEYRFIHALLVPLPLSWLRAWLHLLNHAYPTQSSEQELFWRAYFDEAIASFTKEDYLSRVEVAIDFHQNYNDLRSWQGTTLVIEADNDTFVSPGERSELKARYPQARVYTFHQTGHTAWASQFETFFSVIARFLQGGL